MVGATWQFTGIRGLFGALADLPLVLCLVLAEELLFRGAALRSLRAMAGDRAAIALTALAFGVYHVLGTQNWAMGLAFQFLMPTTRRPALRLGGRPRPAASRCQSACTLAATGCRRASRCSGRTRPGCHRAEPRALADSDQRE